MKIKHVLVLLAVLFCITPFLVPLLLKAEPKPEPMPLTMEETLALYSKQYGVSLLQMAVVMNCESKGSQNPPGHNDGGHAVGIYQYHRGTWENFSKEFGEVLDINSWHDQIKLTAWAFSKGIKYKDDWSCYVSNFGYK